MNAIPCEDFHQAVVEAFEFLRTEHRYWESERSGGGNECWLTFRSDTVGFRVSYEPGSPIWIEILRLSPDRTTMVVEERSSSDMLFDERDPSSADEVRPGSPEELRDALMMIAERLRRFGGDLIDGDFAILPSLKAREAENARRRNQELFGNPTGETSK